MHDTGGPGRRTQEGTRISARASQKRAIRIIAIASVQVNYTAQSRVNSHTLHCPSVLVKSGDGRRCLPPPDQGGDGPNRPPHECQESVTAAPGPVSKNVASNDINSLGLLAANQVDAKPKKPTLSRQSHHRPPSSLKSIGPLSIPKLGPDRDYDSHKLGFQSLV
jgi:hypothetical protein